IAPRNFGRNHRSPLRVFHHRVIYGNRRYSLKGGFIEMDAAIPFLPGREGISASRGGTGIVPAEFTQKLRRRENEHAAVPEIAAVLYQRGGGRGIRLLDKPGDRE